MKLNAQTSYDAGICLNLCSTTIRPPSRNRGRGPTSKGKGGKGKGTGLPLLYLTSGYGPDYTFVENVINIANLYH